MRPRSSRSRASRSRPIAAGKTIDGMLADGEIDALFAARPPSCFLRGAPRVARLFADYRRVEQAYYRKTGIYPLMHAVGIRNTLLEHHPWMARRLFDAFARAKDMAVAELEKLSAFAVTLPWIEAEYRATQARCSAQRYLALRHCGKPQVDRGAVPLSPRPGLHRAADACGRAVCADGGSMRRVPRSGRA